MGKVGKGHVFDNPEVKKEMLTMRIKGYSYQIIASKYGVDHTTVLYHCQQFGICLSNRKRDGLFDLLKTNFTVSEISKKLNILEDVIKFYITTYGRDGHLVFSRRINPGITTVRIPRKIKVVIDIVKKEKPKKIKEPTLSTLVTIDSRGVGWMDDGKGGRVCIGKMRNKENNTNNKKINEKWSKRLEMLNY